MKPPRTRHRFTALVVTVAVGAAACSSSGETGSLAPSTPEDAAISSTSLVASADAAGSANEPAPQSSTIPTVDPGGTVVPSGDAAFLAMLLWLMGVGSEQDSVIALTIGNAAEADVARCMVDAGFQYQEGPSAKAQVQTDPRQTMPAQEYAATYGFGVAASELGLIPPPPADPNMDYVSSLSQGQRDAYYQSYRSCSSPAPDDPFRNSNSWNVALEQFRGAVDADERIMTAAAAWRDCMASAGFNYDAPPSMLDSFYTLLGGAGRAELQQLLVDEISVATANVPCEAALVAARREVITVRTEEFRALFDAAVASGAAPDGQG